MSYNYSNIDTPQNLGSGVADKFLFAPFSVFSKIQSPTPGNNPAVGDEVIITQSHLFIQDEGFVEILTAPFTNAFQAATYGDPGSLALESRLEVFLSGSYPQQHEYIKNAMNRPCLVLIKDSNCGSDFYYQIGSECRAGYITEVQFDTGDTRSGRKGYKIVFTYYTNSVYLYKGTPYLKGVDYGSALLWSAGTQLQYSVGNTLNYK